MEFGRVLVVLGCCFLATSAQKKKCLGAKDIEEAGLDFFRTELERTNSLFQEALDQKAEELSHFLSQMKAEYAEDKAKYGCILDDLKLKMAGFDVNLYNEIREIPKEMFKMDEKFHNIARNFENERLTSSSDVETLLTSMRTSILTEVKGRLADAIQRNEKYEMERTKKMDEFENRLAVRIDALVTRIDAKLINFLEGFAANDKMTLRSLSRQDLESTLLELNSSIAEVVGGYFRRAEDKLVEMDQNRDLSFHDLDDKISELIWPLGSGMREHFNNMSTKMDENEGEAEERNLRVLQVQNATFETLKKIENHIFADCIKSDGLELVSLSAGKYYFSSIETDWYKSQEFCNKYGMQLASIDTEDERVVLQEATPIKNNYYWLSGTDVGHIAGHFYWSTGHRVDETWWSSGQPNDFADNKETCIELHANTGKLIDYKCSDVDYFICELPPHCAAK